LSFKMIN